MNYKNILITGGAGFVGSNVCLKLRENYSNIKIIAYDNLSRRGSELNVPRLKEKNIDFILGDVRNKKDLEIKNIDLIIECSAEPSVMAGVNSSPEYLLDTNLVGALNCFELARKNNADIIFLSTSRIYPIEKLNSLNYKESETRFELLENQGIPGVSSNGISEEFSLEGVRSLYGATKLSAEIILQEYINNYKINGIINRFGLITGPWQMGKVDQGIIVYWLVSHFFGIPLSYIGFGGEGKQVRDILNIDDLFELLNLQIKNIKKFSGQVYNVGGGKKNSISLLELTNYCQEITGKKVKINKIKQIRQGDVRIYISDNKKIIDQSGWKPHKDINATLKNIFTWLNENSRNLEKIFTNSQ